MSTCICGVRKAEARTKLCRPCAKARKDNESAFDLDESARMVVRRGIVRWIPEPDPEPDPEPLPTCARPDCGAEFEPSRKSQRYCSKACGDAAWHSERGWSKEDRPERTFGRAPIPCPTCGADAYEPCRTPNGHHTAIHAARRDPAETKPRVCPGVDAPCGAPVTKPHVHRCDDCRAKAARARVQRGLDRQKAKDRAKRGVLAKDVTDNQAYTVTCGQCGARPGERCTQPSGAPLTPGHGIHRTHRARRATWAKQQTRTKEAA